MFHYNFLQKTIDGLVVSLARLCVNTRVSLGEVSTRIANEDDTQYICFRLNAKPSTSKHAFFVLTVGSSFFNKFVNSADGKVYELKGYQISLSSSGYQMSDVEHASFEIIKELGHKGVEWLEDIMCLEKGYRSNHA